MVFTDLCSYLNFQHNLIGDEKGQNLELVLLKEILAGRYNAIRLT